MCSSLAVIGLVGTFHVFHTSAYYTITRLSSDARGIIRLYWAPPIRGGAHRQWSFCYLGVYVGGMYVLGGVGSLRVFGGGFHQWFTTGDIFLSCLMFFG